MALDYFYSKEGKASASHLNIFDYFIIQQIEYSPAICRALVAQIVKNLPAVQETLVWSLGQEDALEKGMATHSSILAWKIARTEEPGRLQSMRSQELDTA